MLGEGAGILVLESLPHALARGARIYAEAAGAGYSSDGFHISHGSPDGAGVRFAMSAAMRDAGVSPGQVVHINAHATSTQEGDPLEARAIADALGPDAAGCVVSSTKSMTGHLLGGAGAIESVAVIKALIERVAPPTINLEDLDDEVSIEIATSAHPLAPRAKSGDGANGEPAPMAVLNNAFGFGGHNVTLAFTEFAAEQA